MHTEGMRHSVGSIHHHTHIHNNTNRLTMCMLRSYDHQNTKRWSPSKGVSSLPSGPCSTSGVAGSPFRPLSPGRPGRPSFPWRYKTGIQWYSQRGVNRTHYSMLHPTPPLHTHPPPPAQLIHDIRLCDYDLLYLFNMCKAKSWPPLTCLRPNFDTFGMSKAKFWPPLDMFEAKSQPPWHVWGQISTPLTCVRLPPWHVYGQISTPLPYVRPNLDPLAMCEAKSQPPWYVRSQISTPWPCARPNLNPLAMCEAKSLPPCHVRGQISTPLICARPNLNPLDMCKAKSRPPRHVRSQISTPLPCARPTLNPLAMCKAKFLPPLTWVSEAKSLEQFFYSKSISHSLPALPLCNVHLLLKAQIYLFILVLKTLL